MTSSIKSAAVTLLIASAASCAYATGVGPIAGGLAGWLLTKDKSSTTQAAGIVLGAATLGIAENVMENRSAKKQFRAYQLGMYQEAWVRDQVDWYNSTLDRRTGLPPAYDGHWAMYNGLPEVEAHFVARREQMPDQFVPANREAYITYLLENSKGAIKSGDTSAAGSDVVVIPTTTTIQPAKEQNGVKFRARTREFPRLPSQ